MPLGPLALAGLGLGSSVAEAGIGFGFSALGASTANKRQKEFAKKGVRWRMKDMKAGGLNPILAVAPGGSTGAPSVAAARPGPAGSILGSAKKGGAMKSELRILKNAEARSFAEVGTANEVWSRTMSEARRAVTENLRSAVGLESDIDQLKVLRSQLPSAKAIGEFDASDLGQKLIKWKRGAGAALGPLSGAVGGAAAGALFRGKSRPGRRPSRANSQRRNRR